MIRKLRYLMIFVFSFIAAFTSIVYAVSYYPLEGSPKKHEGSVMKAGDHVCLFESGTSDVRKVIAVGDILLVYRENTEHQLKEVGKIKALSYEGQNFIKAEVLEGDLKADDIAKKGDAASLVISSKTDCK